MSLRARLALILGATVALTVALASTAGYVLTRNELRQQADELLETRAEAVTRELERREERFERRREPSGGFLLPGERLDVAGVVWLVALTGLSLLLAIAASSAILGRATGLIAAALGTFVGVRFVLGGEAPSRAVALPLAALLVSLCVSGWLSLNYEGHVGLPATAIAALVAGLIVAMLVLLVKTMPLMARAVVVTLLVGGATLAAFRLVDAAKPPPTDDADEYDYSVFK